MKKTYLLPVTIVIFAALLFTSCKTSRVWAIKDKDKKEKKYDRNDDDDDRYESSPRYDRTPPPPPQSYAITPLILTPTPGFVMNRYPDGRFYHRSSGGLLYWKGYNNKFYLDRSYIRKVRYDQYEYDQWRRFYN